MPKILIVDDDREKIKQVLAVAYEISGIAAGSVDVAYTGFDARQLLKRAVYDLLVLDIALPDRADLDVNANGGLELLREVCERQGYNRPKQIVGLTAYPDTLERAETFFQQQLWVVIQYDSTSQEWRLQLDRKIRYLMLAEANMARAEYASDLCVVTALPVPEYSAVMDIPWNWRFVQLDNEIAIFHEGAFKNGGHERRVIAGCAPRVGMTAAAIHAMKMINAFRPRFLAMVGIAAGLRGQCNMGDILVADPTWDYGSGKWATREGETVFEIAPHQISMRPGLRVRLQSMAARQDILDLVRNRWRATKPDSVLKMLIGPMASGSAVRADVDAGSDVKAQHRKAVGIEMEAYGVMAAAHDSALPEPSAFVMKSVCDFADEKKSDEFQSYAAYTSAMALQHFAEDFMPL